MSWIDAPITIRTRDADLYVEQVGPQEGRVVYYVHGGPGYGSFSFRDLMGDELHRYRMVYADQRAGGRSYAEGAFDSGTLAQDIGTVLGALRLERATLLAHGYGAIPALRFSIEQPEAIERVVLVNPWFSMPLLARTLHRRAAQLVGMPEAAVAPEAKLENADGYDPVALSEQAFGWLPPKQLFDELEFPDPSSRMRLEHVDAVAQFGPQVNVAPDDMWTADLLARLDEVRAKVVTFFSVRDGTAYPDQAEAGLSRLPHAQVALLEGGHYPWLDDEDTFSALLHQAIEAPPATI